MLKTFHSSFISVCIQVQLNFNEKFKGVTRILQNVLEVYLCPQNPIDAAREQGPNKCY